MNMFEEKIKQKAKSLMHWWEKSTEPRFFELELVKLSDVLVVYAEDQKEDQEIRANLAKTCTNLNDRILELWNDTQEHKQKLQPILEDYRERFVNHIWMCYDKDAILNEFLMDWMENIQKFEDLLKE